MNATRPCGFASDRRRRDSAISTPATAPDGAREIGVRFRRGGDFGPRHSDEINVSADAMHGDGVPGKAVSRISGKMASRID